jgi:site-specific recombinase XerD
MTDGGQREWLVEESFDAFPGRERRGMTEKVVWHVVKEFATKPGVPKLVPQDLRRSCAHLCHAAGGELEQIQFLPGHVSVQTTEKYLGCKQRLHGAVNGRIGIEP